MSFIRIDPQLSYSRYGKTMNAADNELKQSLKSADAVEEERNKMDCIRSLPPLNTTCTWCAHVLCMNSIDNKFKRVDHNHMFGRF